MLSYSIFTGLSQVVISTECSSVAQANAAKGTTQHKVFGP